MAILDTDRCFVYGGVVDLRKGADTLRHLVGTPEPGVLYLFSNRTRALLKFLIVDSSGVWCGTRRLHHSRFDWPESPEGRTRLDAGEMAVLLVGGDLRRHRLMAALRGG